MIELRYGNTRTYYISGSTGGLLVDTDYAGTMSSFYKELKKNHITVKDIEYVMATHYHPDHMGLISELMKQGVRLLLIDAQKEHVHYSDELFARDGIAYTPIDESGATVVSCEESREFLKKMGISGELIRTPSHSEDSVSLVLDDGGCIVGDTDPFEYIEAYPDNDDLKKDWEHILSFRPGRILFSHRPCRMIG